MYLALIVWIILMLLQKPILDAINDSQRREADRKRIEELKRMGDPDGLKAKKEDSDRSS